MTNIRIFISNGFRANSPIRKGGKIYIPHSQTRCIRHSKTPNIVVECGKNHYTMVCVATKDIEYREEITVDYAQIMQLLIDRGFGFGLEKLYVQDMELSEVHMISKDVFIKAFDNRFLRYGLKRKTCFMEKLGKN